MTSSLEISAWAVWVASGTAFLWKATQIVRAPRDRSLRLIFACTLLVFLALSAQLAVVISDVVPVPAGLPKVSQNVVVLYFFCAFLCFMQSVLYPSPTSRRTWFDVGLVSVVSVAAVATFATAPDTGADWQFENAGSQTHELAFWVIIDPYMCYACAWGAVMCVRAARASGGHLGISLRIAAVGLLINSLFVHFFRTVSSGARLLDLFVVPHGLDVASGAVLGVGIVVFFLGILYPALRTVVLKTTAWARNQVRFRRLRPLWLALVHAFPFIALYPPRGPWREAVGLLTFRQRYYRRLIECRDGLLLVSPYITEPALRREGEPHPLAEQAELVRTALDRVERGAEPAESPTTLAAPATVSMEADARELVGLARHFARLTAASGYPDRTERRNDAEAVG